MYEFNVTLNMAFTEAKEKVTAALAEEKFGIVSEINVQAVLKKKIDKDIRPYTILGACNPHLAAQVIDIEPNAGTLLPCNVLVREESDTSVVVSFMDPHAVLNLINNDGVAPFAEDVHARLTRVATAIQS